jgi:hypothetical protein
VKAEAAQLFAGVEIARARSPLPPQPDARAANDLLIELHRRFLGLAPGGPEPRATPRTRTA